MTIEKTLKNLLKVNSEKLNVTCQLHLEPRLELLFEFSGSMEIWKLKKLRLNSFQIILFTSTGWMQ